jgi:hypothetical protein
MQEDVGDGLMTINSAFDPRILGFKRLDYWTRPTSINYQFDGAPDWKHSNAAG